MLPEAQRTFGAPPINASNSHGHTWVQSASRESHHVMNKSLKALALALTLVCVAPTYASASILPKPAPTQVFANNCGIAEIKPSSLTQFCADAGTEVAKIRWNTWSAKGASGTGILAINSCDPYCAGGKIYQTKVIINLSGLRKTHGHQYLLSVSVKLSKGEKLNLPPKMKSVPGGMSWMSSVWTTP